MRLPIIGNGALRKSNDVGTGAQGLRHGKAGYRNSGIGAPIAAIATLCGIVLCTAAGRAASKEDLPKRAANLRKICVIATLYNSCALKYG